MSEFSPIIDDSEEYPFRESCIYWEVKPFGNSNLTASMPTKNNTMDSLKESLPMELIAQNSLSNDTSKTSLCDHLTKSSTNSFSFMTSQIQNFLDKQI